MGRSNFGNELREARERQGISIDMAASRLRIRPDILRSIEEGNFSRMPQRGYARNMINAYARYLGLNPTRLTTMYLDELHAYQASIQGVSFDRVANPANAQRGGAARRGTRQVEDPDGARQRRNPPYSEVTGRPIYSDRTDRNPIYDQDDYGRRERNAVRDNARRSRGAGRMSGTAAPASVVGKNRTYDNLFSGNKGFDIASNLPKIIGAVVIIALLIFILSSVVSCATKKPDTTPANLPISGVSDTTNSNSNENTQEAEAVKVAPTSATFQYVVADGKTAYVEVYEDGASTPSVADDVNGPYTGTFQVSTKLKFVTTSPEDVTISVDGSAVSPSDNNDGIYTYTVDFAAILQAWNQANGVRTSSVGTTTGTTTNTTGATGNTTTGTTAGSTSNTASTNAARNTNTTN